jgi:hypothetical protein
MIGYKSVSSISMAEINYKGIHFNIESLSNIAKVLKNLRLSHNLSKKN